MSRRKRVEVVTPIITHEGDDAITFKSLIQNINGKKTYIHDKIFSFEIIEEENEFIIGLIITLQNKDLPPKQNIETKDFSPLAIDTSKESLAYANIFLYNTNNNVLLYEINRSGCFLNYFGISLKKIWEDMFSDELPLSVDFPLVLKRDSYEQILNLSYIRELDIEVAYPHEIIRQEILTGDDFINSAIANAAEKHAKTLKINQKAAPFKEDTRGLRGIIQTIDNLIMLRSSNVKKVKVVGHATDPEDGKNINKDIDLIADSFTNCYFYIPVKALHTDVQSNERKKGIKKVYRKIRSELNSIFGVTPQVNE